MHENIEAPSLIIETNLESTKMIFESLAILFGNILVCLALLIFIVRTADSENIG